ncbi:hypothetical protein [Nitrosopumilus piranensis]|uniref:Protein-disulfide isomerase n=1 Tax=Nitrosopumilus piranensis TaxID=1582439 RepID=A0A0C5BZS2_9ARCH|nr:hypothetical protein [Nitrosopumilus piranensis]AJM92485.1 exported protein of unknown function [Nitrosopumilus piranensis]
MKVSIISGTISVIILAFVFVNADGFFVNVVKEFSSDADVTAVVYSNKINTECELVNFINKGDNLSSIQNFIKSNEDLYQDRFEELYSEQTNQSDSQSMIKDEEIAKIVFAEMIIEGFSINPDLRDFIIASSNDPSQQLVERVREIDPDCKIDQGQLNPKSTPIPSPEGVGKIGSEHSHAGILVKIFGDKFDFSAPAYQIKASWIHFEAGDGTTIHKHATGVTLGYLFKTLGLGLTDHCFVFQDGRSFCTNDEYSLKFFVNESQVDDLSQYEINDGDKILISYGGETPQEIKRQLTELDKQPIIV